VSTFDTLEISNVPNSGTLENALFYFIIIIGFFFNFLLFFFKKNINNIFKLYIINRKLKLRFTYYFMSENPSNNGGYVKPRSRSLYARKVGPARLIS
jgi:hypothetical protein